MDRLTSKEKYDPSIQILYPSKEKYMTYIMRYVDTLSHIFVIKDVILLYESLVSS